MKQEFRPLTQEELLAEAAQTEIENTASVQVSCHSLGLHAHVFNQSGLLHQPQAVVILRDMHCSCLYSCNTPFVTAMNRDCLTMQLAVTGSDGSRGGGESSCCLTQGQIQRPYAALPLQEAGGHICGTAHVSTALT